MAGGRALKRAPSLTSTAPAAPNVMATLRTPRRRRASAAVAALSGETTGWPTRAVASSALNLMPKGIAIIASVSAAPIASPSAIPLVSTHTGQPPRPVRSMSARKAP